MAYITISNSKKIIKKLDINKFLAIKQKLYKWDIYFFSNKEEAVLKGTREIFKNPSNFTFECYQPIQVEDSYQYVFPESAPSYHKDQDCPRLHANFRNFEIPLPIQEKGKYEINKFRKWFKDNKTLQDQSIKRFIFALQAHFPYVGEINPKAVDYSNSGYEEKVNYSLKELEDQIDDILRSAGSFFKKNRDKQNIIRRFQKLTFLAYVNGNIYKNDTGLQDDDLKDFLREYNEMFKQPVKRLLLEYYRIQYNPDLKFEGTILEQLGFKACSKCYNEDRPDPLIFGNDSGNDIDDLPF